jgi:hypothetical protein
MIKKCVICGIEIIGQPLTKYCSKCRAEKIKENDRKKYQRKIAGTARKLGTTDICVVCGEEYTINAGRQKYCKKCAVDKSNEQTRESFKRAYYGNSAKRQKILERAREWALNHPERIKYILHKSYLKNIIKLRASRRKKSKGL